MNLMLDSGAHSLYMSEVLHKDNNYAFFESDAFWQYIDAYCAFLKENKDHFAVYVNVDVIFNPEMSWKVQKYMEDTYKLNSIPVFHPGEDLKWLKKYLDNYGYIGIGGLGQRAMKGRWLADTGEPAWNLICNEKGIPRIKVHGFAMTSPELIIEFPYFSVDSVTGDAMVLVREFGRIRMSSMEELYWSALGDKITTENGHHYKNTTGLETYITDEDGKGFWTPVTKVFRHEIGKPLYKVRSYDGRAVKVTGDHGCFVIRDGKKTPVPTLDLKPNIDRLVCVNFRRTNKIQIKQLTVEVERTTAKKSKFRSERIQKESFPFTVVFTKELMEFFGLWIADGYYSGLSVGMSYANDIESLQCFEKAASVFNFGEQPHKVSIKSNAVDSGVSNIFMQRVMQALGFIGKSHTKQIPWWVFEVSNELICAFLRGYFSGDGSTNNGAAIEAGTVSVKLFYGLFYLLTSVGVTPICKIKEGRTGGFSTGESILHTINIGNFQSKTAFFEKIGFLQKRKMDTIRLSLSRPQTSMKNKVGDFFSCKQEENHLTCFGVEKLNVFKGVVYDLEVPEGQRYVANGILIHNSTSWMQFGKYGLIIVPKKKNGTFIYDESPHIISVSTRKKRKEDYKNFEHLPKIEQTHIHEYLESIGLKMGSSKLEKVSFDHSKAEFPIAETEVSSSETIIERGVCNDVNQRDQCNLEYYLSLESSIPEWPRPWKKKRKAIMTKLPGA